MHVQVHTWSMLYQVVTRAQSGLNADTIFQSVCSFTLGMKSRMNVNLQ